MLAPRSMANCTAVSRVSVSAMPASSMMIKVDGPTAAAQSGRSPCRKDHVSLARVSARIPVVLAKNGGRGSRRRQAEHLAAIFGPGESQGTHGGGFPGASGGDRELYTCPGGAHLPDQRSLPGIQDGPVRRHLQQGEIHRRLLDGRTAATSRPGEETSFGVEDPL